MPNFSLWHMSKDYKMCTPISEQNQPVGDDVPKQNGREDG